MHDGRFANLQEVVNHYSTGVVESATIDPLMEFAHQGGVQLDGQERQLLITFLNTFTDENFIKNPEFADPEESNTKRTMSPTQNLISFITLLNDF
jgi:cytochrome c peroxidase